MRHGTCEGWPDNPPEPMSSTEYPDGWNDRLDRHGCDLWHESYPFNPSAGTYFVDGEQCLQTQNSEIAVYYWWPKPEPQLTPVWVAYTGPVTSTQGTPDWNQKPSQQPNRPNPGDNVREGYGPTPEPRQTEGYGPEPELPQTETLCPIWYSAQQGTCDGYQP